MVRKKIFDITPSQKKTIVPPEESVSPKRGADFKLAEPRKAVSPKIVILFLCAVLLAGGALSYFLIPHKVTVEIWPEQKNIEETVIISVSAGQASGNRIAGEIAREEKTVSQSFPATGTKLKSGKAGGVIRVYNNYSTASQPLLAATRFVSDDGKLFRTPVRVVIPGGRYEGGKLVPGFADIEVAADQPGEDYNIDASTFSIPGFVGTPKYTAFYAKSSEPMRGGILKEVPQVTQSDLDKAKETLIQKAASGAESSLKNSFASGEYILFNEAIIRESADFSSEAKAGEELETFTAQASAAANALVFKGSDLNNFAVNYIKGKIPAEEKLIENFLKIEYFLESINSAKTELSLKLVILDRSYSIPEDARIKEMIKNKSAEDIENILKSIPRIEKAKVGFWPFWVKLSPDDLEDIEVFLRLF